jgi:hypothetical protein
MNASEYQILLKRFQGNEPIDFDASFYLAQCCSSMISGHGQESWGRDLIIRALENRDRLHPSTTAVWDDLTEAAGLYPYVSEDVALSASAALRKEFHRSDYLPSVFFHREQLQLATLLESGRSVIVSAPTSFGKSLLIEDVVASRKFENIVIIQPTLALLDETRKKLQKYRDFYNLVVSTSQKAGPSRNIFLFTGERVVEYEKFPEVDFFVIDEFYKLSLDRDDERASILNQALYRLLKMTDFFYLLGPNIQQVSERFVSRYGAAWFHSDYTTVAVDVEKRYEGRNWKVNDPNRKDALYELLASFSEPTIIYCSGPQKATDLAQGFFDYLVEIDAVNSEPLDSVPCGEIIEWIEENVHERWSLAAMMQEGIAFHHGHLPRHLGSSIVDVFNSLDIKWLFCTSTLIEGVNTTARNVVLFDQKKGRKPIDYFDYKNIVGRSGRMNIHYVGKIYEFHKDPAQLEMQVDVPLFDQANAPIELLLQLDRADVEPESLPRLEQFDKLDMELQSVIKGNTGLPLEGQLAILNEVEGSLDYYHEKLGWKTIPNYTQLLTTLELCWKHLLSKSDSKAGVRSPAQLAVMTLQYSEGKTISSLIASNLESDFWKNSEPDFQKRVQKVILLVLGVFRQWFDYKLPKVLMGLSELQDYVFKRHGMESGNYSYFSALIENDFLDDGMSVLMDYDVPASAIRKLSAALPGENDWAQIQERLKGVDLMQLPLLDYERRKLESALAEN